MMEYQAETSSEGTSVQRSFRVAVINSYLEGREKACEANQYPRSHLWGADFLSAAGADIEYLRPRGGLLNRMLKTISAASKWRFGDLDFDLEVLRKASAFDLIYVPNGRLLFSQIARAIGVVRTPIVYWTYTEPPKRPLLRLWDLWERKPISRGIDGLLCLTSASAEAYRNKWPELPVQHVEWAPDTLMFPGSERDGEYYLACGRTNRDYATLLAAARMVDVPFVIIASPDLVQGLAIPENVQFVKGPKDASTDKGIPYAELIELYANARAVCIPRLNNPSDTSGYTNLLEALAMFRPVIMTRTGKLDLDIEVENVGRSVRPGISSDWVKVIGELERAPDLRSMMRSNAKRLINATYNLQRHGRDVFEFLRRIPVNRSRLRRR